MKRVCLKLHLRLKLAQNNRFSTNTHFYIYSIWLFKFTPSSHYSVNNISFLTVPPHSAYCLSWNTPSVFKLTGLMFVFLSASVYPYKCSTCWLRPSFREQHHHMWRIAHWAITHLQISSLKSLSCFKLVQADAGVHRLLCGRAGCFCAGISEFTFLWCFRLLWKISTPADFTLETLRGVLIVSVRSCSRLGPSEWQ